MSCINLAHFTAVCLPKHKIMQVVIYSTSIPGNFVPNKEEIAC